jgi:hypothetical protein
LELHRRVSRMYSGGRGKLEERIMKLRKKTWGKSLKGRPLHDRSRCYKLQHHPTIHNTSALDLSHGIFSLLDSNSSIHSLWANKYLPIAKIPPNDLEVSWPPSPLRAKHRQPSQPIAHLLLLPLFLPKYRPRKAGRALQYSSQTTRYPQGLDHKESQALYGRDHPHWRRECFLRGATSCQLWSDFT